MIQAEQRLIFALDVKSAVEAEELVKLLAPVVGVFKVGLELFVAQGPSIINRVRAAGAGSIFLDLKLHDIPATMRAGAQSAAGLRVDLLTCHCDQAGIFTGVELGGVKLLGITVLTSLGSDDLAAMGYPPELQDPKALVARRARLAMDAGCAGVVCSGHEAAEVRRVLGPKALVVCPGIRPAGGDVQDQKRVVTAQMAMAAGASHVVVGRPIRAAADPVAAARGLAADIQSGLEQAAGAS